MSEFLALHPLSIRSPTILAEGQLSDQWDYLIFEHIPGNSIGQLRDQIPKATWEDIARQMGRFMNDLHQVSATSHPVIARMPQYFSWESFNSFLEIQRENCQVNHEMWQDLPAHLVHQLPEYILPIDQLLDQSSAPHWIHADLTGDHLLGRLIHPSIELSTAAANKWESLAIIDWGDSQIGNILYELVALHCDLFRGDQHLLRLCLEAYGLPVFYQHDFGRKALSMMLLHQFPMPAAIYAPHQDARTLAELAECIFALS